MDSTNEETATPAMEKVPEPSSEALPDLKAARETRGISLHDIFLATRVSVINLDAVENQEFNRLPPPVYTRDYIRKYARAVGIDAKPLLARYDRHRESLNPPPEETEVQKPWPENGRRYRFLFSTLGAVIVAGILVYALFLYYDQSGRTVPPAAPPAVPAEPTAPQAAAVVGTPPPAIEKPAATTVTPATISEVREPVASPVQAPVAAAPSPPAATGKKHPLVIEARELTWVRITQDGVPHQVLLHPGERIERSAADYFLLDVGNANGISVTYQGKPLGSLGKPGEVIHLRLPAETPPASAP